MKLVHKSFHKNFKLNSYSFSSVEELLAYSNTIDDAIFSFLKDWFSEETYVRVQTSGSTGTPKIINLLKQQMINSAISTGSYFNLKENTKALLCLPIAYIAGKMMLIRAIILGWHIDVVNSSSNPLENLTKTYDFSAMVPLQLENSISKIDALDKLIVGGGVVSKSLETKIQNTSCKIFATYGMTETITHIAIKKLNNFTDFSYQSKSFYEVLPNVKIYKDDRNCLVIDAPKLTKNILFTNDVVDLISDTQFEWLGRIDNVINSGGIKLYPETIEEKLSSIISKRFFVAGIPDKILGEKLILLLEDSKAEKKEAIFKEISGLTSITKFEIPKEIYLIDKFEETHTGKIQRKKTILKVLPN